MSRLISEILNAPEPRFSHAIKNWEQMSGYRGQDIRLISDIVLLRKKALHALGLDTNDTTPRELFYALCRRAAATNHALEKELSINDGYTSEQIIDKIVALINGLPVQRDVWTIKHTVVKQLLLKQPPKKLLKILGLRSIDSMLKRTSAYEVLALSYQVESDDWSAKMRDKYKKLKPVDFQAGSSGIFVVDSARVKKLHKGGYMSSRIVVPNYETGTILVVPPSSRFRLDVLAITLALLQTLYDLRIYSAYFRLISVKNGFGGKLRTVLKEGLPGSLKKTEIGWTVLQRHFNHSPKSFKPIEQPHLSHDDVVVVYPMDALGEVLPGLTFWNDYGHTFMVDGNKPVSMHVMDVITNVSNQLAYEDRIHMHLQQQLWEEVGLRYLKDESVRSSVIRNVEEQF